MYKVISLCRLSFTLLSAFNGTSPTTRCYYLFILIDLCLYNNNIDRELRGATPKEEWRGGLDTTYRVGPGFHNESQFDGKYVDSAAQRSDNPVMQIILYNRLKIFCGEPGGRFSRKKINQRAVSFEQGARSVNSIQITHITDGVSKN